MVYKVLVTDNLDKSGVEFLIERGLEVVVYSKPLEEWLVSEIKKYDALVVRSSTKVTPAIIEAGATGLLKVVGRAGVEHDNIDKETASQYGVVVMNAPYGSTNAVAELVFGFMLDLARKITQAHQTTSLGIFRKIQGTELRGKNLGIVGCGRIGRRVAHIGKYGFGMNVIGYDTRRINDPNKTIEQKKLLDEVIREADFLTVHTSGTKEVIGEKEIKLMKPTAYIFNLARGSVVNPIALRAALEERRIAGAAVDVYEREGDNFENPFLGIENCLTLPHIGASTDEAQGEIALETAEKIFNYLTFGRLEDVINLDEDLPIFYPMESLSLVRVIHDDIPWMFSKMTEVFSSYDINLKDMPSRKFKYDGRLTGRALTQFFAETTDNIVVGKVKEALLRLDGIHKITS